MATWRELCAPIGDGELPALRQQMSQAASSLGLIFAAVAVLSGFVDLVRGVAVVERLLPTVALSAAGFLAVHLSAARGLGTRRPDVLLAIFSVHLITGLSMVAFTTRDGTNPFMTLGATLPLVISAFVPWRPSFSLVLAAPAAGVPLLVSSLVNGHATADPRLLVVVAVCFGSLSAVANQLHRRLWLKLERTSAQVRAAGRMSTLGSMTAGIAHELKTPVAAALNDLASARTLVEELRSSIGHPDVGEGDLRDIAVELVESVSAIELSISRAARFVQAIRAQTIGMGTSSCAPVAVKERVDALAPLFAHRLRQSGVSLHLEGVDDDVALVGDSGKLDQILVNLVSNALDACVEGARGKHVTVTATRDDGSVTIAVQDDGPGVPAAVRARIFEPLFTTRGTSSGTGLGLSIARDIAEAAFGGTLRLVETAKGARFELCCPDRGAVSLQRMTWVPASAFEVGAK